MTTIETILESLEQYLNGAKLTDTVTFFHEKTCHPKVICYQRVGNKSRKRASIGIEEDVLSLYFPSTDDKAFLIKSWDLNQPDSIQFMMRMLDDELRSDYPWYQRLKFVHTNLADFN